MRYSIEIDHKLRLIRYKHPGKIRSEDIQDAWFEFLKMPEFTQNKYRLLSDYRGGKFQIQLNQLAEIIEFMRSIEDIVREKKQAIISDDPYSVAGSTLFKKRVYKETGFDIKVFTTETAALKWLAE